MTADYEIILCRDDGLPLKQLHKYQSLRFSIIAGGVGSCTLAIDYNDLTTGMVAKDRQIQIWRAPSGKAMKLRRPYLIRRWNDNGGSNRLTLYGKCPNYLLGRAVIFAAAGSAYTNKTAAADDVMKAFVRENRGALATDTTRAFSSTYFGVQADLALGPTITKASAYKNLLNVLQELSAESAAEGVDQPIYFDIVTSIPDGSTGKTKFEFQTFAGQLGLDRTYPDGINPLQLSTKDDTLSNPELDVDYSDEANVVYVGGKGEGSARATATATGDGRNNSLWARREIFYNASNQAAANLDNIGAMVLRQSKPRTTFRAEFGPEFLSQYGEEWDVGYKLTAVHRGQSYDVLVRSVEVYKDSEGNETITPGLEWLTAPAAAL